jgi:hypothetical protein
MVFNCSSQWPVNEKKKTNFYAKEKEFFWPQKGQK